MRRNQPLLGVGVALDVACGLGQNSMWLARHGYSVLGVDLSLVALRRARAEARVQRVLKRTCFAQVDLDIWEPAAMSVDLICVFRFLDRQLIDPLKRALRPGGLIFYETRHRGVLRSQPDANPAFLLRADDFLQWFGEWHTLYEVSDSQNAAIVARKPG